MLATERHESRRIDNQLRGRSGRQGDPGRSKFYLALDDDLMRIFGSNRMDSVLKTLGLQDGEAITHPWMNKSLEMAQKKVEARNFDIRKQILKYDDVMNDQRKVIFEQRLDIMGEDDVSETVKDLRHQLVHELVRTHIPETAYAEQWNTKALREAINGVFDLDLPIEDWASEEGIADQEIAERILQEVDEQGGAQGRRARRRQLPPDREDGAAADARPPVARASRHAGASAPGDRLPRLRPARSAQRVQERGVRAVRGDARQPARGRHRPADARRAGLARGAGRHCSRSSCRKCTPTTSIRSPGLDELALADAAIAAEGRAPGPARARSAPAAADAQEHDGGRSDRPGHLGPRRPQRPVPVRLRQEVQALPRQERLTSGIL